MTISPKDALKLLRIGQTFTVTIACDSNGFWQAHLIILIQKPFVAINEPLETIGFRCSDEQKQVQRVVELIVTGFMETDYVQKLLQNGYEPRILDEKIKRIGPLEDQKIYIFRYEIVPI